MATLFESPREARSEERFFFTLTAIMAAILVAGFSFNLAAGRSSFDVPLVYHLHAFVFFGWLALQLAQTGLAAAGNFGLHRRLGWLAVLWLPMMVVMGVAITLESMHRTGGPFFFDANEFLISNPLGLMAFAGTVIAAIVLRKRTDWHRRLMLGALASILGPGIGRLLPMPLLMPWAWEVSNLFGLIFVGIAALGDRRRYGKAHPAWLVVALVAVGWIALGQVLAYSDWGVALTQQVLAGHPGAARPMEAYLPG